MNDTMRDYLHAALHIADGFSIENVTDAILAAFEPLDASAAAALMGVSKRRVYQYCQAGRLGHWTGKTWVIFRHEAQAFEPLPTGRPSAWVEESRDE